MRFRKGLGFTRSQAQNYLRITHTAAAIKIAGVVSMLLMSAHAHGQIFKSGNQAIPLIELFTSEGCSSCPPADRWLVEIGKSEHVWSTFVPLAFHVDYWDYIGWKDPFASREYSQRQRRYAKEFSEPTVYTPGVRKSGEQWRRWYLSDAPDELTGDTVGAIRLEVEKSGRFKAEFFGASQSTQLTVALLGIGLSSVVKRGENQGKTLRHDFVVLGISRYAGSVPGSWEGSIPVSSTQASSYAIAAWVTKNGSLKPIQATGGLLARGD